MISALMSSFTSQCGQFAVRTLLSLSKEESPDDSEFLAEEFFLGALLESGVVSLDWLWLADRKLFL